MRSTRSIHSRRSAWGLAYSPSRMGLADSADFSATCIADLLGSRAAENAANRTAKAPRVRGNGSTFRMEERDFPCGRSIALAQKDVHRALAHLRALAFVAERAQVHAGEQALARAEQDRPHGE